MTPPTPEQVAALEQWAKQERDYAFEMGCGTDYTSVNKQAALGVGRGEGE